MSTKATLLKLDKITVDQINQIVEMRGLRFATVAKMLIHERLRDIFPVQTPTKATEQGTAHQTDKGMMHNV